MTMHDTKHFFITVLCCVGVATLFAACGPDDNTVLIGLPVEMVRVEGGSFEMGDPSAPDWREERPVHTVTLSGFYMSTYEVTQAQYREVMGSNPSFSGGYNCPVELLSWYSAVEFCNALSEREGLTPCYTVDKTAGSDSNNWLVTQNTGADGYRLPTEAEWEYAAKGGNGSPGNFIYAGSNTVGKVAWYMGNADGDSPTHVVGTKSPNGLGLYDMSGNVAEWCWDWYGDYSGAAQTDPQGPTSGSRRVVRGGHYGSVSADVSSSSRRNSTDGSGRSRTIGFRIARSLFDGE